MYCTSMESSQAQLFIGVWSPVTLYAGETENDRIDRIDTSAQNLQSSMIFGRCMVYAQYNPILSKDFHFSYTLLQ